ncbi:phage terminase small subunit P27 family [Gemmobacter caeruleus]|uniref:phage terminase small subunit P27 family n=1 Tax=Gemmobacter caeruleus TaxID=2595004 RepID=UPI00193AAEF2
MAKGPKPQPTALRRLAGNPGKRGYNHAEPQIMGGPPDCPPHLCAKAQEEWHRLAEGLYTSGVVTIADRAAFAAYCQCYARWVEAEEKLAATPTLLKTPSGYIQQSPWLSVANKQLELMGRYMAELGLTPAARTRVAAVAAIPEDAAKITKIELVMVGRDAEGNWVKRPINDITPEPQQIDHVPPIE